MATVHQTHDFAAAQQMSRQRQLSLLSLTEIAALIAAIAQILVIEIRGVNTIAQLGPVNLQVADLATPLMPLLIGLMALRRIMPPPIVIVILVLYSVSLLRGFMFEPSAALTALRFDITFLLLLLSVSSGGLDRMGYDRVRWILIVGSLIAVVVSLLRFAYGPNFLLVQGPIDIEITDDWNDGRTLGAPTVLIMALAAIFSIARDYAMGVPRPRLRIDAITVLLLIMIVASGQRTALLGFVIALGLMCVNRVRPVMFGVIFIVPVALFILSTGLLEFGADTAEGVGQGLGGRSGTFEFRTVIWRSFFDSLYNWTPVDLMFGLPLGQRPSFYLLERVWTASLHSAYVGFIPIVGFFGTIIIIGAVLYHLVGALHQFLLYRRDDQVVSTELRVYLAAILIVFGVSYEWRTVCGIMLGCLFLPYRYDRRAGK